MKRINRAKKIPVRAIAFGGILAAIYAALTLLLAPISYGSLQFRVSEALTVLPALFPWATPGLFVGCLVGNLLSPIGILDIIFGSLATLLAAILTGMLKNHRFLMPLPPVLVNAVMISALLYFQLGLPFWLNALYIGGSQAVICYGLGLPLHAGLKRIAHKF